MSSVNRKLIFLYLAFSLSACSSLDGKFKETQYLNLAPFSENIVVMANQLNYDFDNIRALHSKWYFDRNAPKFKNLLKLERLITVQIHFVVEYSSQIVHLSESSLPMIKKTSELSLLIREMYTQYSKFSTTRMTQEEIKTISNNIKKQGKFLHALQTAQPVINDFSRQAELLLDKLKKAQQDLALHQYTKIDYENDHIKQLILSLTKNEVKISKAIILLNRYENGEISVLNELISSKILLEISNFKSKDSLSKKQIDILKKHLLNKLTENTKFFTQIEPGFKRYQLAQRELLQLVNDHDDEIRKSRLIFIAFASAHRKMSSGLVKSAKWFDIKEAPKLLFKLLPL